MAGNRYSYLQPMAAHQGKKNKLNQALSDALPGLHGPVIASAMAVTLVSGLPAEAHAQSEDVSANIAPARKAGGGAPYAPRKGRTYAGLAKGTGGCIMVTDAGDSGVGTLREAVIEANVNIGLDCIEFDQSIHGSTITLTTGELASTDLLSIDGPGSELITISGGGNSRVIRSSASGGTRGGGPDLSISGLTIQDGMATGPNPGRGGVNDFAVSRGGGVYSYGSLSLSDCVLTGNTAIADASATDLNYINARAETFALAQGGGAFAYNQIDVDNCTISNNTAQGQADSRAYATYALGGPAYVSAFAIGIAGGGGLAVGSSGDLQVLNSTISGNTADADSEASASAYYYYFYIPIYGISGANGPGRGGGVNAYSASDAAGGGLFAPGYANIRIYNSTVSGNTADAYAYAYGFSTFQGYNATALANSSGGGIQNGDDSYIRFATVVGNNATAGAYSFDSYYSRALGGGISEFDPAYSGGDRGGSGVLLFNSIVDGNSANANYSYGNDLYDYSSIASYSLIGYAGGNDVMDGVSGNIVGQGANLGPLQDNGGDTLTHLPNMGSPVIDAGDPGFGGFPYYDQRGLGFPRIAGNYADMGAVEYGSSGQTLVTLNFAYGAGSISRPENGPSVIVGVELSQHPGPGNHITVNFATSGTATPGADFSVPSSVVCYAYATTYVCDSTSIQLVDDTIFEQPETMFLDIDSINGPAYEDGMQQGMLTITDNDGPPTVSLGFNRGGSIPENGGSVPITATLSNQTYQQVTVDLEFPADQAVYGTDFDVTSTSIIVPPFTDSASIDLNTIDDAIFEGNETFSVGIASVTNGTENGMQQVQGDIQDNEGSPPVTLSLAGSPFDEPGGVATVTATRGAATTVDCIVDLGFTGVAINGTDYTPSATQITIPPGMMDGSITLTGLDDMIGEGDEDVIVDITTATGCTETGTQQVTAIITDDDEFLANLAAVKSVIGMDFTPGDPVTYLITITNAGPGMQQNNPGDEFVDVLPPELALIGASADSGTAFADVGNNTVTWNGVVNVGTPVNIMIDAQILQGTDGVVENQGTVNSDTDGDGTNDSSAPTDDPDQPGATDPTPFTVLGTPVVIPTLSSWGIALLGLLLPATAMVALRRRGWFKVRSKR